MNWRNVRLIFAREIRDQLRDRRTLFMIAVLPMLLYPLLGTSVFQLSQFMRKHEARVLVIGAEQLENVADLPALFADGKFAPALLNVTDADRITLQWEADETRNQPRDKVLAYAQSRVAEGAVDAALVFPTDFAGQLVRLRKELQVRRRGKEGQAAAGENEINIPQPEILFSSAKDKSRVTQMRLDHVLDQWRGLVARQNLLDGHMPLNVARPFSVHPRDIAEQRQRDAVVWSKILPFVLFIWALTGAFYPSVDLCPGEKERGTLETLLSSPALRSEIVWGKLLTIMTFSGATALLNLASLGITAQYVISQLGGMAGVEETGGLAFPPLTSLVWLLVALVPMSALFSALCLACAAFARSTKEGQYYFMPLFLVTMPLMMLPMSPGVELNLGNSLIPVTGVVLLLRSLIEGRYAAVLPYVFPVVGMTLLCCLLAVRWAIEQFQQESVLFGESERLDLRRWIVHLVRDRSDTPVAAQSLTCVALILVVQFFVKLAVSTNAPPEPSFRFLTLVFFISQVVCIALPAVLMTMFLTARPWKTLLLDRRPAVAGCVAAILLAVFFHPVGQQLALWITQLYPISEDVVASSQMMVQMLERAPYPWLPFLLVAVLPALCEELAFRGFVLSGFRRLGHKWWAIGLSAVFFGVAHTVLQQSLSAFVLGLVLGFVAVQTGSLVPCVLFHMTYNGLMLLATKWNQVSETLLERIPALRWVFVEIAPGQVTYGPAVVAVCALLAAGVLVWLHRLPYQRTAEEQIQELRAHQKSADSPSLPKSSGYTPSA